MVVLPKAARIDRASIRRLHHVPAPMNIEQPDVDRPQTGGIRPSLLIQNHIHTQSTPYS